MDLILLVLFVLAKDVGFFLEDLTKLLDDACLSVVEVTLNVDITLLVPLVFFKDVLDCVVGICLAGGPGEVVDMI